MSHRSFSVRSARPPARTLVSCSLRFSRQGGVEIRSLDDLLWTIQPLNLRLYDAASLRTPKQVGEGASYTVFRYTDARTRTAVAVKKIKPPDDVNDHFAFQNRVDCVLKDIEVMHHPPIAQHENILTLLGYGWGLRRGDLIPFIVTDYASLGTLREYLQTGDVSMPSKLSICSQVACGLNRLHWTGVGHGDLKLENVLVFPNPSGAKSGAYETDVIAKLSDFGHACLFSDEQREGGIQIYRGTLWYLAPEIQHGSNLGKIEFLRCDVWALGLLCWEVLWNGAQYYNLDAVKSIPFRADSPAGPSSTQSIERDHMFHLCPKLAKAAETSIDQLPDRRDFRSLQQQFIKVILRITLQEDPQKRPFELTKLPFIFGGGLHSTWNEWNDVEESSSTINSHLNTEESWSYETFTPRVASRIPFRVKAKMVLDAKREALGQDKDSARAALQTGLALLNGFGIEQDIPIALQSVRKSAALGCVPADMLLLILNDRHPDLDQPHSAQTRAAGPSGSVFSASGIWASLGVTTASSYRLLSPWGRSTMRHSAPQVDVALLGESLAVNDEYSAPSREDIGAAIQLSCQLGDLGALKSLLPVLNNAESSQEQEAGAEDDCAVPDPTPLHYLFMFDKERQSLDRALECLLPKHEARHHILESCCVETQRLDLQLPFFLAGTPLGFAVCAGSSLAVEALICAGANPLNRTPEQDIQRNLFHESPLEKAISYHQSDMLQGLWRASLSNPKWRCQLIDMCLDSKEPLFAKLCVKSRLERWINHRGDDRMAQQRMVSTLTSVAWELVSTHKGNTETVGVHTEQAFMRALAAGLGKIIELDGLETADDLIGSANEIIRAPLFSLLQELEKETLVHALLRIACEGTVPPRRATAYIKFGELAFPGISPSIGFQVLVASIRYHNDSLFSMMVTDGRYFDEVDSDGKGILHHIIDAQFSRLIPFSEVLELVKDRDATDESGETPLHHAVRLQYLDETAELISAGADPTRKLPDGDTILHLATRNLDLPMIRCLVDLGMPANETNGSTQTALHALFLHWQQPAGVQEETCFVFEVANLLLSRGASCSVTDQSGWTAVHALALWDDELVRDPRFPRLLKALDLTVRGVNGSTILHSAILGRRTRLVSELLRAGMSVDDQDHDGATALHALASCATAAGGRSSADDSSRQFLINIATELLKAKPNLALDDTNGSTALECIIMECYESFVSIRSQTELLQCVLRYCSQKTTSEAIPVFDILLKAFRRAVMAGRWIAVWELLTLPTLPQDEAEKFLRWPVGIRLLVFGIVRADVAVLRRFLGDGYEDWHPNIVLETGILDQEPDPRQLGILSERSKQWSLSKHMNWERGVPQQTVHRSGGSRGVLRELLEFFIKHQDLYKMGPLRPVAKDKVPNSWRIIDNLMITVVNEFKG